MTDTTLPMTDPDPAPTPVKPGWRTTEFWLKLAALALTALYASGAVTNSVALAIAGIAATMLGALGYTVSRAIVKAAAVLLLVGLVGSTQLSCSTVKALPPVAAHAVVDCTKQDGSKLLALALDFAGQAAQRLLAGKPIDWDELEARAETEGTAIGQCAYVLVADKLHPAPTPVPTFTARLAPDPALVALARLRGKAGGVSWRLPDGTLR